MNQHPIQNHKAVCRAMSPAGWQYCGFDEGCYLFQAGNYGDGFKLIKAFEEDLSAKNLALMAKLGVTRD